MQIVAQDIGSSIVSGYQERKEKGINALKLKPAPDTARVNALTNLIGGGVIQKQRHELMPYFEEALQLSRKLDYKEGLSKCYVWKGNFHKAALERARSHLYFDSAIRLNKPAVNDVLMKYGAQAQRGKALIYFEQENYYAALSYFFEALKYYEHRDRLSTMNLYTIIANIYSRLNNFQQAIVYATKNAEAAEETSEDEMKIQAWISLAEIHLGKNELVQAIIYLNKVKPYMPHPVQVLLNSGYYMNKGLVHFRLHQYDSSHYYFKEAFAIASKSGHNANKTAALYYISLTALKMNKPAMAKKYADENMTVAQKSNAKIGKINALLNLSDYYHATGYNSKAFELLQQAAALKDSLLLESNINQINTLAAVYESEKKEKEIIQLQNEKDIQESAVKQKSTLNKIFIASIFALLLFGYLGYANIKKAQQIARQQQAIQRQKIIELEKHKQLVSIDAMLKGQEEERSRIAKDLHDGLGSLLSGTKLSFINVRDNMQMSAQESILWDKSLSMLDNTIVDLRKVAQNLMPEALVKFGLNEALSDFCNMINSATGIKMICHHYGEKRKLSNTAEVFIYRIIQELVNNVVKHADATEVIVQLILSKDQTVITVEDNGNGFDSSILASSKGAGMSNIAYRVQYYNGTTDIVTSPGNGTSVNIELKV
ncbi:MAG: hypothetical protein H7Y27_04540 [Gemmatimonadaceae bacterium]|nr:hypothetical protein [Chitinophagaceae bacterium]